MRRNKGKKQFFENNKGKQQYKNYENLNKENENNNSNRKKAEEQEEKFRKKLLKKQYNLHIIERDGNCLFSSISDQVYGTDKHRDIIREKCMDYIEKNKLFFSHFIEGGETQMPEYIKRKRQNGKWGDNLEIQALSEIYNRPIEIYVDVDKTLRTFNNVNNKNSIFPIKISYHGNNHYNSIVPSVNHSDFPLYKSALLTSSPPGVYETNFIKNYDITKKFNEKYDNFNEPIEYNIKDYDYDEEDFLYNEVIEKSKNDCGKIEKEENLNEIKFNDIKSDEEYLSNPIVLNALEFGFNLEDAIEALKICGNNEEMVMNYLCNK